MLEVHRRLLHDDLILATQQAPDKTVMRRAGRSYRYQDLFGASASLASSLIELGLERGDRVAIFLENDWPVVVSIYATLLAGGVIVLVNPQTKSDKLSFLLADSEARLLITDRSAEGIPRPRLPQLLAIISTSDEADGMTVFAFDDLLTGTPDLPQPGTIPLDLAALIYTSGSTGQPKGVMLTHQNMVFTLGSLTQYLRLSSADRLLNVLPLAFDYGLYQLLMTVRLGATLILERNFNFPAKVLDLIESEKVSVVPGVPTVFGLLLSAAREERLFPGVTRLTNTAAALPETFVTRLGQTFPNALIYKMYGLTECKRVCYLEPELAFSKRTSVGKAIPGTETFLLDEDGRRVPPGTTGILHVRGPHVMLGYWKQPELSARMLKAGQLPGERILCTHDHFVEDEEGFLYFVGRSDDIIKSRGEKVSPLEVEEALYRISGVREAAVVGVPDPLLGEAVVAYLVTEAAAGLTERLVQKECLAMLESYMVPRRIIFVDELPKTASGKIRKLGLTRHSEEGVGEATG